MSLASSKQHADGYWIIDPNRPPYLSAFIEANDSLQSFCLIPFQREARACSAKVSKHFFTLRNVQELLPQRAIADLRCQGCEVRCLFTVESG